MASIASQPPSPSCRFAQLPAGLPRPRPFGPLGMASAAGGGGHSCLACCSLSTGSGNSSLSKDSSIINPLPISVAIRDWASMCNAWWKLVTGHATNTHSVLTATHTHENTEAKHERDNKQEASSSRRYVRSQILSSSLAGNQHTDSLVETKYGYR